MTDKISIIVPIYNTAPFLEKCVSSMVNQTYKNIEIILVNDGSKDNSLEILKDFAKKDSRVVVVDKPNGGIGTAYKAGLEVMTGDAVYFVDSDDWLELDAMEKMMQLMKEHDVDYVAMNMTFTEARPGHTFYEKNELVEGDAIMERQFVHYQHSTICRLHKKHLLDNIVIYDQNIGVDAQITPQVLHNAKRGYITKENYYNTLVRDGSISRSISVSEKQVKDTIRIYRFIIHFMEKNISKYVDYMRLRYIDLLLEICKGALFVSKKEIEPLLPEILSEFKKNYDIIQKSGLYSNKRVIDKIQVNMILKMRKTYIIFVQSGLFTKLGLYK